MSLHAILKRIVERREVLTRIQARTLLDHVLTGAPRPISPAARLAPARRSAGGHRPRRSAAELAGFADAMLAAALPMPLDDAERRQLVDSCGTGGDDTGTFNISTAAALVASAAGATVAKHGNRAVTSKSGSADVLEALGIPIGLSPAEGAASLRAHRFAFLHAPSLHPAMKAVMPVRRALGVRTVFNVLGSLANPAGARAQVMGVFSAHLVPIVADAMRLLGTRHAFVVHGALSHRRKSRQASGIDELSISGPSQIAEVRGDDGHLLPPHAGTGWPHSAPIESLRGGDAAANAAILRAIFSGERGPRRDLSCSTPRPSSSPPASSHPERQSSHDAFALPSTSLPCHRLRRRHRAGRGARLASEP